MRSKVAPGARTLLFSFRSGTSDCISASNSRCIAHSSLERSSQPSPSSRSSSSVERSSPFHETLKEAPPERFLESLRPIFKALLVDAAGTLLIPSEPAAEVYLRYGRKHGVMLSEGEVLERFRKAYGTPWGDSSLRYVDDGRPFWRFIVRESTGSDSEQLFEEIYEYYARGEAWCVCPGAIESLKR